MAVGPLLLLFMALAIAAPDWTDCPMPCRCKWSSGKKTASCRNASFTALPHNLHSEIQILDLSGNAITRLEQDAFKTSGLMNLQKIFVKGCRLREIHRDAFRDLIILVEVDLSENDIRSLDPETFHGNERLRHVYLNGNPLRRLEENQFPTLANLKTLQLEECLLEFIHENAFRNLANLETINLSSNRLRNLTERSFRNLSSLKSLALDGNPWTCDCNLRGFRDWYLANNFRSILLACSQPEKYSGRLWETIHSEDFACPPRISISPQRQVQAEAGGNVSFGCHVTGDPEPEVTWLLEGQAINHPWVLLESDESIGASEKWSNISISNVSDADVGVYTCVANNSLDTVSVNVTLVLPEIVTAPTLSKSENAMILWIVVCVGVSLILFVVLTAIIVLCVKVRGRNGMRRRNMKASVSFTDQEKKLLDVSIATTTDRGTGSCEALATAGEMDMMDPPVHITIESEPLPLAVFPPPPEFSTNAFGNIFISVSVSRDPTTIDTSRCPDLLDLPHRPKPIYHGMATLPRRPYAVMQPQLYDNMGPRVTAGGSSTLSLPDSSSVELPPMPPPIPMPLPTPGCAAPPPLTPEFVSL
ncbi:Immunoglobulin [Oryctes borbonicus]|uniref:Immunoglobulin n=1 Tax=Oryctes borbonicus TaxID=1629725 RepID=A0A0T6B3T3_9SCAR|nr:Immunoglobulin [Oryctes borbonicus]